MSAAERVACFAFDSASIAMLEDGLEAGRLPMLAGLLDRGRPIALADNQEIVISQSWATLIRGVELPDHGLFADRGFAPGEYRVVDILPESARVEPFWRHISDAGMRSVTLSPYSAPMLDDFHGVQVTGWGAHDPFDPKLGRLTSHPPELVDELERLVGGRTLTFDAQAPAGNRQMRSYIDDRVRGCDQQARAARRMLADGEWCFAFAAFSDCHQAGHWLWHVTDPGHPSYDPALPADIRGGLMRIYEATDRAIGTVIDALPEDTVVLLVSPYDMIPNPHLEECFPAVLERGGWLVKTPSQQLGTRARALQTGRRAVRAVMPLGLRRALGRVAPRDRLLAELAVAEVDWAHTRAFGIPGDGSCAVRLNLAGRDPAGCVEPGAEANALVDDLAGSLLDLRCADTGRQVVARVARWEELYDAEPYAGPADLFVQWARTQSVRAVCSDRLGEIPVPRNRSIWSYHSSPGFVVGAGPGIEASGARAIHGSAEAKLIDVAPTVLSLLGVPVPDEIGGRPIAGLAPAGAEAGGRG